MMIANKDFIARIEALETRFETLEGEHQRLLVEQTIRDRVYSFCRALDRLDRDLLASIFHPDATLDYGSIYTGPVAGFIDVAMQFQGSMRDTQHNVGHILIDVSGDHARVESYVYAHHVVENEGELSELIVGARYFDRFEHRDGEWKIAFRTEVMDWGRMIPIAERWFEEYTVLPKGRRDPGDFSYRFLAPDGF